MALWVKVRYAENAYELSKAYEGDAGYDIYFIKDTFIPFLTWTEIHSGVYIQMESSSAFAELRPRGSSIKRNLVVYNGLIDSGYTGELSVFALSLQQSGYLVKKGESVAQLVFHRTPGQIIFRKLPFKDTQRGSKRLGSSG